MRGSVRGEPGDRFPYRDDTLAALNATADLVYTGRGALCWIHEIDVWAQVVARLLCKGGVLSLFDDHPASWLFSQESSTLEASGLNYFAHAETNQGWPDEYIGDLGKPVAQYAIKHERLWTIADVFQALVSEKAEDLIFLSFRVSGLFDSGDWP